MPTSDWLVEYREGVCHHPWLGRLPGLPFRMRRRSEPSRVYVIDDRNAGERFHHGSVEVVLISGWAALDLLAGMCAEEEMGQVPDAVSPEADGALRSQAAVSELLCIGRTRLNALIKALPPEEYGAARLISKPDATKKRRVWHEEVLEAWLDAAVAAEATAGARRGQEEAQPTVRRRRQPRGPSKAGSFKALVRGQGV